MLVIISPILEELMFRGLGFKLLERYGHATAIVLTGLAFGLFHGQLQQLPALIAFGCAMGYLRSATNSIYPGIATHALLNLTSASGRSFRRKWPRRSLGRPTGSRARRPRRQGPCIGPPTERFRARHRPREAIARQPDDDAGGPTTRSSRPQAAGA